MNETTQAAVAGPVDCKVVPLVEKLRNAASAGFDEWRVQDPADGSYCIAYSWPNSMIPERDARAWLAHQNQQFPKGRYADYVVACVRVVPQKDRLLAEAADEIQRLTDELREGDELRDCLAQAVKAIEWQEGKRPHNLTTIGRAYWRARWMLGLNA